MGPNSEEDVAISSNVEEDKSDEKDITNKSENSDVCEKESNDLKIEQEKIDAIENDQPKSEAHPPQEEGTESLKSNELEDDKPNSDDGKLIDDNQVDGETEKEAGEAENSDVCEEESNDSEIEEEKIDEIEDYQQKSELCSPLGNATEETVQDMDEDSSPEEIIEIKETEIDDPQEEVTESLKSNEIEDDKPNSDAGKFIDDSQVDEESEKEVVEAGMIESAINSQEDVVISSDVEEDGKDEKNITNKTEISDVCEKESNDSEIEQEKIDEIEDDQQKSEASNPLGNATEETVRDIDEDSSQEEIIEIKETEIDDPLEEGTETIKSTEITE